MKKIKIIHVIILWFTLSLVATYLKLTNSLNELTEVLFLIVFLLSVYIIISIIKRINNT